MIANKVRYFLSLGSRTIPQAALDRFGIHNTHILRNLRYFYIQKF